MAGGMERVEYLDRAKALGMVLVYYGHFTEQLARNHYGAALLQMKFIYSFHMPLFFFVAGIFWKPVLDLRSMFGRKIQNQYLISHLGSIPDTGKAVFLFSLAYVVIIITSFSPIVMGMRRWILELVGYPWASHSLLPPVNGWFAKRVQQSLEVD